MRTKAMIIFASLVALVFTAGNVVPQSRDLTRLQTITRDLSDAAQDVRNIMQNANGWRNRNEIPRDLSLQLNDFANASRSLSGAMANNNTYNARQDARQLIRQAERIDGMLNTTATPRRALDAWGRVQDHVSDLAGSFNMRYSGGRELGRSDYRYGDRDGDRDDRYGNRRYGNSGYGNGSYGNGNNYFRWQGVVDGTDVIRLRGNRVTTQHIEANPIRNASFDLPAPLPTTDVRVQLTRLRGRGRVELLEQPTASNNYTAVVRIEDADAGTDYYNFELRW